MPSRVSLSAPTASTRCSAGYQRASSSSVSSSLTSSRTSAAQAKLVDGVRHELDQLRSDMDRQQGALSQVGGEAARERLDSLTEALNRKRDEQDDRTREYDAWKLLKETLEEAEKSQSTHLGQALMQPRRVAIGHLPQAGHHRPRPGQLKRLPQPGDAFA
jgi:chromosome segregation ATPase